MDWSNITTISNVFGGLLVLLYAFWTIYNKVASDLNIMTKRQKDKKEQKEKEEEKKYQKLVNDVSSSILSEFSITVHTLNDLLRIEINKIYYKYNRYRKIRRYDKENCAKMVEDYTAQGGNSYVHELWEEICEWEVVSTWEEVTK